MSFLDHFRGFLGGGPPDPAGQAAVEEQMLEFIEAYGELYTKLRLEKGYSPAKASNALLSREGPWDLDPNLHE